MIFENNVLQHVAMEEGRARLSGSAWAFDYFLKDHLGNVRAMLAENGTVLEETHYYPFGLVQKGISTQQTGALHNKEKTFQNQQIDKDLDLNWVQFKWRNHDPQIGRFIEIDPLSEEYEYNSTYAFSENKVTGHIELEGLEAENFMSKFKKLEDLRIQLPDDKKSQIQKYQVTVQNAKTSFDKIKEAFENSLQDILSNSKAAFSQPVDKEGNRVALQENSFIKIDIDGPLNNGYVKVVDFEKSKNDVNAKFVTLEGHVEKGVINFGISKDSKGNYSFTITSMSEINQGAAKVLGGVAREQQKKSWVEVLNNFIRIANGEEKNRQVTTITP